MKDRSDKLLPWTSRELWLAGVMLALSVGAMWSCWCDWLNISYHIEEHSHVFMVVPFGAAIMLVNRKWFRDVRPGTSWVGPIIVAIGAAMGWHGYYHAHQSLWHMGAVLVAVGAVVSVLGHGVLVRFWPAFLILAFMVPVPQRIRFQIAHPLQSAMAGVVEHILSFFGEPVGRQGNSLTINGQQVLIVEACNGLRMVFALLLVNWLFAFVTPLKPWAKWMIILMAPVTALIANVIRLIPTLLLYGHANSTTANAFHDYAGWAMLPVAFVVLMFLISFLGALGIEVTRREKDLDNGGGPPQAAMVPV